jgi:hypothetical protein
MTSPNVRTPFRVFIRQSHKLLQDIEYCDDLFKQLRLKPTAWMSVNAAWRSLKAGPRLKRQ